MSHHRKPKSPIICRCNNVNRETIEKAIREGCDSMNQLFDATTAGVGPCGGSCRRKLVPLLEYYLRTGTFPDQIVEDKTGKAASKTEAALETDSPKKEIKKTSDENQ